MNGAFLVDSVRTPLGKARRGPLTSVRPDDLAAMVVAELVRRNGLAPDRIDEVILGCAMPEAEQGLNVARIAALRAGLPHTVPGLTVNRFCASGLEAIALAAERIMAGHAHCIVAGGTESMSQVPMTGHTYCPNPTLVRRHPEVYTEMGLTAELLAERFKVSRGDQDQFAMESHRRAVAAADRIREEILPIEVEQSVPGSDGRITHRRVTVATDDGPRADTSLEVLGRLRPAFREGGTVTAGNSSPMSDGAAASLVVSERLLADLGLTPRVRVAGYVVRGVPPEIMGIGPVEAVPALLARAGLGPDDIGLVELNEAFAAQAVHCARALHLDPGRVNVNGGAIALGHPMGCTGARLVGALSAEMVRRGTRWGVTTLCVASGMGVAGLFERA